MRKGQKASEETKRKQSIAKIGNKYAVGSKGWVGRKHSKESKDRMSITRKGKKNPHKGHKQSEETKKMLSEIRKLRKETLGYINSPESRQKLSDFYKCHPSPKGMSGHEHSDETKEKMCVSHKGFIGHSHSEETKEKMRASWDGNEDRLNNLLNMKGDNGNHIRGMYISSKAGEILYRSSFELRMYKILDADDSVVKYDTESLRIAYVYDDIQHIYIPDICAYYIDGMKRIIEVKPAYLAAHDDVCKAKFCAAKELFGENFIVVTEHELNIFENEHSI